MTTRRTRLVAGTVLSLAIAGGAFVANVDDQHRRSTDALDAPALASNRRAVAPPVYGSELPATWTITDGSDVAVHVDPTASSSVTGSLRSGTSELDSTGRIASHGRVAWREVKVPGATTGWVDAARLVPMSPPEEPAFECHLIDGREVCDTFGESEEGPGTE